METATLTTEEVTEVFILWNNVWERYAPPDDGGFIPLNCEELRAMNNWLFDKLGYLSKVI